MAKRGPKILVMGCGGIGGVVAAGLLEQGERVYPVARNPAVVEAIAAQGFRMRGESGPRTVPGRAWVEVPADEGPFDLALLATQPPDAEDAVRQALPHLTPDARVVCFQNGLCEERVGRVLGDPARVIGGIVAWGAQMVEPGLYDRTSAGGFVLGRYDGRTDDPVVERLATLLEAIGPVQRTDNLAGARWSKLALNCAISALGTVGGDRLGALVPMRIVRRLALEIMTEVVQVARRLDVRLEKVSGTLDLDWVALTDAERRQAGSVSLASKHALLLAVGLRYRRLRSSMLWAIERGRKPAVDFLNGEIVERARRLEIPAPVNAAVVDRIWAISRGEVPAGRALVAELYRATR
jgi:2-dehydropantoate 2-reductase